MFALPRLYLTAFDFNLTNCYLRQSYYACLRGVQPPNELGHTAQSYMQSRSFRRWMSLNPVIKKNKQKKKRISNPYFEIKYI